jgi:phosphoribosylglycinamide formyltransferase-1
MNPPLILGVIGSGKGSNCRAIIESIEAGQLNARIGIVISDVENAGILSLAVAHGIPSFHLPPGKFKTKLDPSREIMLVEALQQYKVGLVVLAGYMRMVKEPMIEAFPRRMINVHPSLLPAYPGLRAWEQALLAGERRTGCTVHYVDAGMDTGDILAQQIVSISESDTPESLHQRIQVAEHQLLPQVIGWFAEGKI